MWEVATEPIIITDASLLNLFLKALIILSVDWTDTSKWLSSLSPLYLWAKIK